MTRRISLPLLSLGALTLLGGCAAPLQPMEGTWHHGTWIVTDAFASGGVADTASAPRGQPVPMEAGRAGDASGRVCPSPLYAEDRASLASVIGASAPDWPSMAEKVPVLLVECLGRLMATYAVMSDGALLTRYGAWVLRLEHGEKLATNPAPMMAEPVAPPMAMTPLPAMPPPARVEPPAVAKVKPPVVARVEPPAAAAAPAASHKLVYLASYKSEDWARKGWGVLTGHSSSLKEAEPVMKAVEIQGKGTFVRLFASAKDDGAAKLICKELGKAITECGVMGRE
jgi:hypothetical protein